MIHKGRSMEEQHASAIHAWKIHEVMEVADSVLVT